MGQAVNEKMRTGHNSNCGVIKIPARYQECKGRNQVTREGRGKEMSVSGQCPPILASEGKQAPKIPWLSCDTHDLWGQSPLAWLMATDGELRYQTAFTLLLFSQGLGLFEARDTQARLSFLQHKPTDCKCCVGFGVHPHGQFCGHALSSTFVGVS